LLELDSRVKTEQIEDAYDGNYYGTGAAKFPVAFEHLRKLAYNNLARQVHRTLHKQGGAVLDVGCGSGAFLAALGRLGHEIHGIERPGPAYNRAAQVLGIRLSAAGLRADSLPRSFFAAVTFWHVLEHLKDPEHALRTSLEVLEPDGLLFLEVPNVGSYQARLFGARWLHFDPPRHIHQFTRDSLERLLDRTGFEIVQHGTYSLQMGAFGWLQGLLDTHIHPANLFYQMLLTRGRCRGTALAKAWSVVLTLLIAPLAGVLTLVEAALGQGAVLRCVCRKRPIRLHSG